MKRKRKKVKLIPRLGPATNIRPAGAHESKKLYRRHRIKAVLRIDEDGFLLRSRRRWVRWKPAVTGREQMSRFPAELTVTLHDGRRITECFNQAEMAHRLREDMLERLKRGDSLVIYDGDQCVVRADQVASVQVIVQDRVPAHA